MRAKTILVVLLLATFQAGAQDVNYDESKVPPFKLEDPLKFADGRRVKSVKDWTERRAEILEIFQSEMYGRLPEKPEAIVTEVFEEGTSMAGFATRRQVRMWFRKDKTGPYIDWLIMTPNHVKGPAPTVIMLNYEGNHSVIPDKEVVLPNGWIKGTEDHRADESQRGLRTDPTIRSIIPVNMILARGYAFVTACYEDVSPDPEGAELQDKLAYTDIFELWGERDPKRTDNTTSLMAWGWALMRGMDMIEQDPMLDQTKVVLTGSSRLGKAALIAGAFDDRFPVVVPNQTGGGGVPLAKRYYGENVRTETTSFTHWYCRAYDKYADNEASMPFDQHLLLTCVAPRALLVEGFDQGWFDTKGEFLSVQAASPVWRFLGKSGLPKVSWPDDYDTKAIGPNLGYVRRDQEHGIAAIDWQWMLDFADKNLKPGF